MMTMTMAEPIEEERRLTTDTRCSSKDRVVKGEKNEGRRRRRWEK
jgi:hypothetical protein